MSWRLSRRSSAWPDRNLSADRPDIGPDKLDRLRGLMMTAVRDWRVSGYEPLIASLVLPDPHDRHVLAASIRAQAQVIVTNNLQHFPAAVLDGWDVESKGADELVLDQIGLNRQVVYAEVARIADARKHPPQSVSDVLSELQRSGLVESVAALLNV